MSIITPDEYPEDSEPINKSGCIDTDITYLSERCFIRKQLVSVVEMKTEVYYST